jgi:hypothetical protein
MIEPDDFHLKHHVYSEMAALPVKEFNMKMREVMAGTKDGSKVIKGIIDEIKGGLQEDEFNEAMNEMSGKSEAVSDDSENAESFDFKDLFGNSGSSNSDGDSDGDEGINFEDLFKG